ncbi:MAG: DUF502 domain-containing protein [Candidatus Bipolaricaulis sp.]|nr:DUF502 domain-containing protein [Candidatus Bipolaricaulis sp.]MDD5219755.1 DUF502 domain-containing protein [Candidatus Bipolaricaulis sp.]MDD5645822.1 DUF502 domain-containing protein [Candidatus Bipolaricaulis sp.]
MKKFLLWLRATFVSGLLAILPIGATAYILWILYNMLDGLLGRGRPLGDAIERAVGHSIPGLGIALLITAVLIAGVIARNIVGRTFYSYLERVFLILPGIRKMYGTFKQFAGAMLDPKEIASFKRVVMIEYPKNGVHMLGLVTNESPGTLSDTIGEECLVVYVPTVPNPLSGAMVVVPKNLVTYIDMPVEDMLSLVVSSGSALPESLRTDDQKRDAEQKKPRLLLGGRRRS